MNQTGGMIIRRLAPADHAAWLPLWHGYIAFYEASVPDDITALTWMRLLDPIVPLHGWVAERDGQIIGFAHALEHLSTWSATPYVYLEDLFVSPQARAGGAGGLLIEAVHDHAFSIGAPKVYWQTAVTNATARKLYDRVASDSGFMVYDRQCATDSNGKDLIAERS